MGDNETVIQGKSEAEEVAKIVQRLAEPKFFGFGGDGLEAVTVLAHARELTLTNVSEMIDRRRLAPRRKTGTANLSRFASFVEYAERHRTPETAIYVYKDDKGWHFRAVFNGHAGGDGGPGHGDFGAWLTLAPSDAFRLWSGVDGHKLTQAEFAELVEARIAEVVPPEDAGEGARATAAAIQASYATPQAMLSLSKGLSVRVDSHVKDAIDLSSGETKLVYEETIRAEAGQDLKVPGAFLAAIPIFDGGVMYQIPIRIRFRAARGAAVTWILQMYRIDLAVNDAIEEMIGALRAKGFAVFEGRIGTQS